MGVYFGMLRTFQKLVSGASMSTSSQAESSVGKKLKVGFVGELISDFQLYFPLIILLQRLKSSQLIIKSNSIVCHELTNIYLDNFFNQMPQTNNRSLTAHEKQAYQGAKSFYYCFLPFCILCLILIDCLEGFNSILLNILSVGFYWVSMRYYKLCNQIDTYEEIIQEQKEESLTKIISQELQDSPKKLQRNQNQQLSGRRVQSQILLDVSKEKPEKFYCKFCRITLPYRSRHCLKCRRCVKRYDHHCFWIGNCVGAKNHREFYFFLILQTVQNAIMEENIRSKFFLLENSTFFFKLTVYCIWVLSIGFILFTGYLFIYHTMLAMTGQTTWEHLRRKSINYLKYLPVGFNPFSKGVIGNFSDFLKKGIETEIYDIPTFEQAKQIDGGCSLIQNEYYNCC